MTKQQTRLCQLMLELHTLCNDLELDYYLIGQQLLFVYKKDSIHGYEIDVAMFYEDWQVLADHIKDSERYDIESVLDGGNMFGCYYRFVDKETLMLDADWYGKYKKPGIGINVHIIRKKNMKSRYLLLLENGLKNIYLDNNTKARRFAERLIEKKGRAAFSETMSNLLQQCYLKKDVKSGGAFIYEPRAPYFSLDASIFANRRMITFQGMALYTFSRPGPYLVGRYGKGWRKVKPKIDVETYRCIFSDCLPYEKYINEIESKGLLSEEFSKMSREYGPMFNEFRKMEKYENDGWEKTMFVTGERYRLWKEYMPKKPQIKRLYDDDRFDELEIILSDYIAVLRKYLKKNIVVCFDEDILDVVRILFLKNGNEAFVNKIDRYVLEEDLMGIYKTW